jgi:hypothetical protein
MRYRITNDVVQLVIEEQEKLGLWEAAVCGDYMRKKLKLSGQTLHTENQEIYCWLLNICAFRPIG